MFKVNYDLTYTEIMVPILLSGDMNAEIHELDIEKYNNKTN